MSSDWRPTASKVHLEARAEALTIVRQFFADRGVLEVQTPLLGSRTVTDPAIGALSASRAYAEAPAPEGADAGFLQTSTEYHQKRLLAAGIGDNYTCGPVFRADEQGRLHNPEFTMLEWYRLGFDDTQLRLELSELVDLLLGAANYHTHSYANLIAGSRLSAADKASIAPEDHADLLLVQALEALGPGRHFIVNYPAEAAALARLDSADPQVARRFELVIDGVEVANGYFELNDLEAHRVRFATDNKRRKLLGLPQVALDTALLEAIESGLPDCSGVAVGFDRLLMLRLGVSSIEEVQSFGWSRR